MAKNSSTKPKKAPKANSWSSVDPLDVLTATKDKILLLGDTKLTDVELKNLQMEAKTLKNFRLWSIMQNTIKQKAIVMGLVESETWERTISAKMMLLNLDILKSVVDSLLVAQPLHTPPVAPRPPKHLTTIQ